MAQKTRTKKPAEAEGVVGGEEEEGRGGSVDRLCPQLAKADGVGVPRGSEGVPSGGKGGVPDTR